MDCINHSQQQKQKLKKKNNKSKKKQIYDPSLDTKVMENED